MKSSNPVFNQTYINIGKGQTVILLHGLFGNLSIWKPIIHELKDKFNVIVPRLPLFELPTEHTHLKYVVQVLHEYIDFHQFQKVILVGHAVGGQVAVMYAQQYPENVARLVLTSSSGLEENSPILDTHYADSDTYNYVYDKIVEAFYLRNFISSELVDDIYSTVKSTPKRMTLWNIARSSRQNKVASLLSQLYHPVLLIWGLQDKITPPEAALQFHDLLPNSELKFIDQCGHLAMVEKPAEFNAHILSFLLADPHKRQSGKTLL